MEDCNSFSSFIIKCSDPTIGDRVEFSLAPVPFMHLILVAIQTMDWASCLGKGIYCDLNVEFLAEILLTVQDLVTLLKNVFHALLHGFGKFSGIDFVRIHRFAEVSPQYMEIYS